MLHLIAVSLTGNCCIFHKYTFAYHFVVETSISTVFCKRVQIGTECIYRLSLILIVHVYWILQAQRWHFVVVWSEEWTCPSLDCTSFYLTCVKLSDHRMTFAFSPMKCIIVFTCASFTFSASSDAIVNRLKHLIQLAALLDGWLKLKCSRVDTWKLAAMYFHWLIAVEQGWER